MESIVKNTLEREVKLFSVDSYEDFKAIMKNRSTSHEQLKEPLINGVVRKGDALIITGPSKIGKTMRMMELASALENGGEWLGFACSASKVMFLNPEVHEAEFHHRERKMFQDIHIMPFTTVHIMGKFYPLPVLIKHCLRAIKEDGFNVFIFDSIYMIISAKEKDNDEIKQALRQFDRLRDAGATVIYSHHHRKGANASLDATERYAGASVHGRYVSALIDISYVDGFASDDGTKGIAVNSMLRSFTEFTQYYYQTFPHLTLDNGEVERNALLPIEKRNNSKGVLKKKEQTSELNLKWAIVKNRDGVVTYSTLKTEMGIAHNTLRNLVEKSDKFEVNQVGQKYLIELKK